MIKVRAAATGITSGNSFPGYLVLYVVLYAAYGTETAYMPAFLGGLGLSFERIGIVLAAGTVVRIVAGPLIGHFADRFGTRNVFLTIAASASGFIGFLYLAASGFLSLLIVSMAHASATASLAPLSDALAVTALADKSTSRYGWVRGAGSAAFVVGTLMSGQFVEYFGLPSVIVASSVLFLLLAICAGYLHRASPSPASNDNTDPGGFRALWGIAVYRRLVIAAMLVIGSHALNDAFAVIHWRDIGYGNLAISLLWSEAVAAEILVFFLLGSWLIQRLGLAGAATLSAAAGAMRWGGMAITMEPSALIVFQALHGLTFALLHLVAMGIIAQSVPARLAATAQTIYGTGALGVASALMTIASGYLMGWFGTHAYWYMAALCAAAIPLAASIGKPLTAAALNADRT